MRVILSAWGFKLIRMRGNQAQMPSTFTVTLRRVGATAKHVATFSIPCIVMHTKNRLHMHGAIDMEKVLKHLCTSAKNGGKDHGSK